MVVAPCLTGNPIIGHLDVFEDISPGLGAGDVLALVNQLGFEGAKKTFDRSVVITVALAVHTTDHLGACQQRLVVVAGVLTAPVGVGQSVRGRQSPSVGRR